MEKALASVVENLHLSTKPWFPTGPTYHKSMTRFCLDLSWRFRSKSSINSKARHGENYTMNIIIQLLKIAIKIKILKQEKKDTHTHTHTCAKLLQSHLIFVTS